MIGTAGQARVDACKGGPSRAARSPTIAADVIPACPAGKWRKLPQNRMAEKLQEIAGVGIAVRITNPRARFVKTLSRIGAHGRKPRRRDGAAVLCPPSQKRLTLPCGATPPFPYNQLAPKEGPSVSKEVAAAILTQTYFHLTRAILCCKNEQKMRESQSRCGKTEGGHDSAVSPAG
jgi:hypothetical protein